jgi:hypothetical protein
MEERTIDLIRVIKNGFEDPDSTGTLDNIKLYMSNLTEHNWFMYPSKACLYCTLAEAFKDFIKQATHINDIMYRFFEQCRVIDNNNFFRPETKQKFIDNIVDILITTLNLLQCYDTEKQEYINGFKEEDFERPLNQYSHKTIKEWKSELKNKEVY